MNILFFGDRLTAGYGLSNPATESFPALIKKKIDDENLQYKILNGGQSGDTSAGGLNRINYWINQPIHTFVLELGINDIIRGITPTTTIKNLQSIINKVRLKYPEVKIAVMGMEIPTFIPGLFGNQFKAIFKKLSEDNKTVLVPFFLDGVAGHAHLNLNDGLHPSAEGYKIIANNVWPILKKLL